MTVSKVEGGRHTIGWLVFRRCNQLFRLCGLDKYQAGSNSRT